MLVWLEVSGGLVVVLCYYNVYGFGMLCDIFYFGVVVIFCLVVEKGKLLKVFEDGG